MLQKCFTFASKVLQTGFKSESKVLNNCFNVFPQKLQNDVTNARQLTVPALLQHLSKVTSKLIQIASKLLASKLLQFTLRKIEGVRSGNFAECLNLLLVQTTWWGYLAVK